MANQKIIILDFKTAEVHVFDYDPLMFESYEEFYNKVNDEFGHDFWDNNCQCMIVDELSIKIH